MGRAAVAALLCLTIADARAHADCGPSQVRLQRLGATVLADIDPERLAERDAYCSRQQTSSDWLIALVRLDDGSTAQVAITPVPDAVNLCRQQSRGLQLSGQGAGGLLYRGGGSDGQVLACFEHAGGPLTISCTGTAPVCEVNNLRPLAPGCFAWIQVTADKAALRDWPDVIGQIDGAIRLTPSCNRG